MNHKLSLKHHCIETEIKKQYNINLSEYFKHGSDPVEEIEVRIEMLKEALETLDFGLLRSRYPALRGNSDASVALYRDQSGRLHITIDGKDIEPQIQI